MHCRWAGAGTESSGLSMTEFDGSLVFSDAADDTGLLVFIGEAASGWLEVSGVKVWTGSGWERKPLLRFNGVSWEAAAIKVWIGLA